MKYSQENEFVLNDTLTLTASIQCVFCARITYFSLVELIASW